jgi:hypothetical protein
MPMSNYEDDLQQANDFIDYVQKYTKERTILIGGNHDSYRIERWAAKESEGKGTYNMLSPHIQLMKNRTKCTYIRYGGAQGTIPHYKLNSRIICVNGWSYAQNAAKIHLRMAQGKSIVYAHCHRMDTACIQDIWSKGTLQSRCPGCMCQRMPLYGTGNPVEWVNGFIVGYLGKRSDTLFTVDIKGDFCILPDGTEVTA